MEGLTEGRIVHYVMPNGEHRPAIIVHDWHESSGCSNLNVFTDYSNDVPYMHQEMEEYKVLWGLDLDEIKHGHIWRTSIMFSAEPKPNTWHWIEKA